MAYTDGDPLVVRIRIAFGASIAADPNTWAWTDVTAWWHASDEIRIEWGRSPGAQQAETSKMFFTLKNPDPRFTAFDARSPYWPNVRKWTPIQYDIDLGDGSGWRNRFSGYIRKWPLTWPGGSGKMALAKIEAVGVLGRLARGKPPRRSALRRTIAATSPVVYYPGEDGVVAGQAGSEVAGAGPLAVSGVVEFKPVDDYKLSTSTVRYGTSAVPDLSGGGTLSATFPGIAAATGSQWTVHAMAKIEPSNASDKIVVMEWTTPGGTSGRWQLVVTKTSRIQVFAFDAAGASTMVVDYSGVIITFTSIAVSAQQVGGNVQVTARQTGFDLATGTIAGTIAGVTSITVNATGTTSTAPMPAGHIAVWATTNVPYRTSSAQDSYVAEYVSEPAKSYRQEAAVNRLARLTAEDGVRLTAPPVPANMVTRMGWQAPDVPTALYQECEDADLGLLYETGFGLGYLPRAARYNAPVALTIDAAVRQLGASFEPVDDDQMLRNRWTVERREGSTATAEDKDSIDKQGELEGTSNNLNLATDLTLQDQARFRLRLATVQEPRYPNISFTPSNSRGLAAAWCACKPGSRVQVINPPAQHVPGVVDQLIVGATEIYDGRRSWKVTLNTVPARPWDVATVDGPQRVAADGTTLTSDVTAAALSVQITSTAANGRWTTRPAAFPLDMLIGGEHVIATAITGTGLTQTVTLSARAVNGVARSWLAGTPVTVLRPAVLAL
ncbi:hypothetical protein [Micromonospora sp. WMMD1274]|uniref:hypothetical protein n=1 Tax=Micromonospora sp. WMMD1274 TaxID=3404116 RepID=UPI003B959861